ncbi:MAG: sigma-70 family RNA polymerase sigma factor [Niastella sp.]|nr:sigma-70 family RNA polymerase sigma factor [Niastella sp.]PZR39748.1 MAG: hypothetical protein DI538_06235 [Azospira oryzae]
MFISCPGIKETYSGPSGAVYRTWWVKVWGFLLAMGARMSKKAEGAEDSGKVVSISLNEKFEAQIGDAEFSEIFEALYAPLTLMAKNFVNDVQVAEDVVSEVFVRFWQSRKAFQTFNDIRAYLYVSTRNKCYDILRHQKVEQQNERALRLIFDASHAVESLDDMHKEAALVETMNRIYKAIESLPDLYRRVITLLYFENMPIRQIAQELGKTYKATTHLQYRALKQLKISIVEQE